MIAPVLLTHATIDNTLTVHAAGKWTILQASQIEALMNDIAELAPRPTAIHLDLSGIERLDTYGAWLVERFAREWQQKGVEIETRAAPESYRDLITAMHGTNHSQPSVAAPANSMNRGLEAVGRAVVEFQADLSAYANMLGAVARSTVELLRRPRDFRLTSTVHHLDQVGWRALPIITLITVLIGGIIAQQGIFHFRKFGADLFVVDMVGIMVLREFGVLIVAIMVAGRSGSSYTAELGSMKMREEIDALRTMGSTPIEVLILPRLVALILALTILTFIGSMAALAGGGMVAWFYGDMNPDIYIARIREAISITHFKVGMIKAPFMALVIGIVACTHGLRVRGSAESLGLQTTESVVKSIFLVIVLDGFFAIFFASIGM